MLRRAAASSSRRMAACASRGKRPVSKHEVALAVRNQLPSERIML